MSAGFTEYYIQLKSKRTKLPIDDDSGTYIVMTAGSPTLRTIYSNEFGSTTPTYAVTGVAQTMTNGIIRFWTATSSTEDSAGVDITILTANGQAIFVDGLLPSDHSIEVDEEKMEQLLIFPYYNYLPTPFVSASVTATGSAWSPGFALPAQALVKDAWVKTYVLGTGATHSFGISGTPSGLVAKATTAVTGIHYANNPIYTAGTDTFMRGTLLLDSLTNLNRVPYVCPAATTLVFINNTVTTLAAATGWVYISYDKVPGV